MPSTLPLIPAFSMPLTEAQAPAKPANVEDAARQFESLLISQMLHSARETGSGGLGDEEQESENDTMMGIADQQFAQLLARQGGLGLSRLVVDGLSAPPAIRQSEH